MSLPTLDIELPELLCEVLTLNYKLLDPQQYYSFLDLKQDFA